MGVCNCSMFCCMLLYVHSSIAIILMGKRELIALLNLSSWCLLMVERLFLVVPQGCLWLVIVVFPDHTYYFFMWLATLQFEPKLQNSIRMGIAIFKIFIPEIILWYIRSKITFYGSARASPLHYISDHISDDIPAQMKILNTGIPLFIDA